MRILVIDDDVAFLGMVRSALEEEGHAVMTATDGTRGLAYAAQQPPDAIVLDLIMPIGDGKWFARAYARQPGAHAPIIVISSQRRGDGAGIESAAAHLTKPFELDQLLEILRSLGRVDAR